MLAVLYWFCIVPLASNQLRAAGGFGACPQVLRASSIRAGLSSCCGEWSCFSISFRQCDIVLAAAVVTLECDVMAAVMDVRHGVHSVLLRRQLWQQHGFMHHATSFTTPACLQQRTSYMKLPTDGPPVTYSCTICTCMNSVVHPQVSYGLPTCS